MAELDFKVMLNALADAAVVADGSHRIVYLNPAAERLLHWSAHEIQGQLLTTIIPLRLRRAHSEGFKRYCATHEPHLVGRSVRVPALRKDGSEVQLELSLSALQVGQDDVLVALLREVGNREELERPLRVTRYLRATAQAAATLGSRLKPEQVLETVVETLVSDFDAALARIWLLDPAANLLLLRASAGLSSATTTSSRASIDVLTQQFKVGNVARTLEPYIKNVLVGDPEFDQAWVLAEGIAAAAVFPLVSGGELRGVLAYFSRSPLHDEVVEALKGFIAIVITSLNDVELFAREQAARIEAEDQRQMLQTILDMLPMGVLMAEGPEGPLHVVNPAGREIWGDALEGRALAELPQLFPLYSTDGKPLAPEDVPLWRALRQRQRAREIARYRRQDGQDGVVDVIAAPFPGASGGAVATYRDVTSRFRMESELAERAGQFKALFDHLPVGVAYFDHECVCRASNGPALRILGRAHSEIKGVSAEELFAEVPELRLAVERCVREQTPHAEQAMPWPDPAGGEAGRYLDWRFEPLPAIPPRAPGALALVLDVTDRTRAEEALKVAKEAAEQTAGNKSRFLSAVSHDLRTPVNALSLLAELLSQELARRNQATGEVKDLADNIHQAATNLIELLNDLLDLAQFDSNEIGLRASDFSLDDWLSTSLEPLRMIAAAKNLALSWHTDKPGRALHADRVKLTRVLTNLVGNAIKFTEAGSIAVSAATNAAGVMSLSVADTGPGIPEAERDRIFDEFAQLRNPERDRTKGTGLGLAICKRLVEAVGGRLTLESQLGHGSTFTALFPAVPPPQRDAGDPAPAATPQADAPPQSPLLVVEDDSRSREALSRLLRHVGFTVETAADGPEALESLHRVRPSLVLLDIMLPGLDGVEVLRRIRAEPALANVPVVLLSGDVQGAPRHHLLELNVAETLAKPIDFDALRTVIAKHVRNPA
ncbi:MAG TPA: ATP-binding protein [Isosphaeraceae bacterium]|nr:ATP-binding protein [Isosphaeraceae bacterium]